MHAMQCAGGFTTYYYLQLLCSKWCVISDALGWQSSPFSFDHFFHLVIGRAGRKRNRILVCVLAVSWQLWLVRNGVVFREKVVHSPLIIVFGILFLTQWKILLNPSEAEEMEALIMMIQGTGQNLRTIKIWSGFTSVFGESLFVVVTLALVRSFVMSIM